jgi:hypothetical protein
LYEKAMSECDMYIYFIEDYNTKKAEYDAELEAEELRNRCCGSLLLE